MQLAFFFAGINSAQVFFVLRYKRLRGARSLLTYVSGRAFVGGFWLDIDGTLKLLNQVRERDKALLRGVLAGEIGMVFCWER